MQTTLVCDIQRFSVHDGPGIRTTVFFKGCPLRCLWCQNPETLRFDNELVFSADRCIACGDCAEACPHDNIQFKEGPVIDRGACRSCFTCAEACPSTALQPAAREYGIEELVSELVRDREFFGPDGGITLSGGEPLARPDFLRVLLPALREEGHHVAVQTCGHFKRSALDPILRMVDLVIFDIKAVTGSLHRKLTGRDNRLILENLRRLVEDDVPRQVRMPLVPGLNDAPRELDAVAGLLAEIGLKEIWVTPYHRLGESKLVKLDSELKPLGIEPPPADRVRACVRRFESAGLTVRNTASL